METQTKENYKMTFLYIKRMHSLEAPNSDSLATNGRRLQPKGSYNSLILWLQPEGGYNLLGSPVTTGRWIQPPFLAPFFHHEI
jgi:hypothetical protein